MNGGSIPPNEGLETDLLGLGIWTLSCQFDTYAHLSDKNGCIVRSRHNFQLCSWVYMD